MPDNIGLIVAFVAPVVAMTVLRINAVLVFLSLCLGDVLVRHVSDDASVMLSLFSSHKASSVSQSTMQLVILLLPAVLTAIFMVFSIKGRSRVFLNIIPAAGAGFLGLVLAVPLLPQGASQSIQAQAGWQQITHAQALVIGGTAVVGLFFLWAQRRGKDGHEPRHR